MPAPIDVDEAVVIPADCVGIGNYYKLINKKEYQ